MRHLQLIRKSDIFPDRIYEISWDGDKKVWIASVNSDTNPAYYEAYSLGSLLHRVGIAIEISEGWAAPRLVPRL